LGYAAASNANFLTTFRDKLWVPYSLAPEDRTDRSVRNYHYSLRHNPEERSSHPLCGGSLKSQMDFFLLSAYSTSGRICIRKSVLIKQLFYVPFIVLPEQGGVILHNLHCAHAYQVASKTLRSYLLCPQSCVFVFLLRFHVSTLRSSRACLLAHVMDACLNLSSLVRQ
jgi:hypothetical protein